MEMQDGPPRLTARRVRYRVHGPTSLLGKVVATIVGAAVLVAAFVFSLVVLAILLTGGLVFGGYLWWRTRDLRKRLREQQQVWAQQAAVQPEAPGRVFEGEAIRDTAPHPDGDGERR